MTAHAKNADICIYLCQRTLVRVYSSGREEGGSEIPHQGFALLEDGDHQTRRQLSSAPQIVYHSMHS